MRRRDIPQALFMTAAGATVLAQRSEAQSCTAPCFARTAAEITAGVTPVDYSYQADTPYYDPRRLGLVNDNGSSDQTSVLNSAYAVCKAGSIPLQLPRGTFRFTSALVWDGAVAVRGVSRRGTILMKDVSGGDFNAITIESGGRGCEFADFALTTTTGGGGTPPTAGSGHGIVIGEDTNISLHDVDIFYQSGHGLFLTSPTSYGNFNQYRNLGCLYNGGDGIRVDRHSSSRFDNINSYGNVGWGFNIPANGSASSFHSGTMVICQANGAGGAQVASQNNVLQLYGEGNTGPDINLTSNSYQNYIISQHTDSSPSDLVDLGTRNIIVDVSAAATGGIFTEALSRAPRTTNAVGLNVFVVGGKAGSGASAVQGGAAFLVGGPSAGSGNAPGGAAIVDGGDPVGSGDRGLVILQPSGGSVNIGTNAGTENSSVGLQMSGTTRVLRLNKLTTSQRDALAAVDGMLIYNTTLGKFQGREAGSWVNLA